MNRISESEFSLFVSPVVNQELFSDTVSAPATPLFPWGEIIAKVYLIGVVIVLFVFIYAFLRIVFVLYTEKKVRKGKLTLILTERPVSSFSWMKYVVIPSKDWKEHGMEIFQHEKAHVLLKHSWDLLLLQICMVLYWFNPVIWFIRRELQDLHEFEADEYVIRKGADRKEYQLLLIKKAVGIQRFVFVTNSFNHSKLKRRIYMMQKKRSTNRNYTKYLFILPLCVVAVTLLARPEVTKELDKISGIKITETTLEKGIDMAGYTENDSVEIRGYSDGGVIISNEFDSDPPVIILDGKEITQKELRELDPEKIGSITVLKNNNAMIKEYGEQARNGVILIQTKEASEKVYTYTTKRRSLPVIVPENIPENLLIMIDGKEIASEDTKIHIENNAYSLSVARGHDVIGEYGERAKDGLVRITTLNKNKNR